MTPLALIRPVTRVTPSAVPSRRLPHRALAAFPVIAAVLAAFTAAGCGSVTARPAASPQQTNVVVAAVPAEGAAGLYIAQDDGLFARAGLHVTIKATEDPTADIPALLHGSVDVLSGQYITYIAAEARGIARMRILAAGYALGPHVQEIMTGPKSRIRSMTGLKGQTIAVNAPDSVTTDLLYTALAPYGISPGQIRVVTVAFPAMPAALAAGRVAAIYEIEPFVTEAAERYGDVELADIDNGATAGFPVNGYGTLTSWAAANPATARAFTAAIEQGNAIAATNAAARQRAIGTSLHLSPAVTTIMAAGSYPTALDPAQIQRVARLMLRYGQLSRPFDVSSLIGGGRG
jgi:NitT/TauT family transport system substrate-binding protein